MGRSTLDVGDVGDEINARDWDLEDPDDQDFDRVRAIRDGIEQRVKSLFDEINTVE